MNSGSRQEDKWRLFECKQGATVYTSYLNNYYICVLYTYNLRVNRMKLNEKYNRKKRKMLFIALGIENFNTMVNRFIFRNYAGNNNTLLKSLS